MSKKKPAAPAAAPAEPVAASPADPSTAGGFAQPTGTQVGQAAPSAPMTPPVAPPAPDMQTQVAGQAPAPAALPLPGPAAAPAKPPKIAQNGVTKPGAGTTTGKIWEVSDAISGELKAPAPRAKVMEQCKALGINEATIATQYGKWRKFHGLKAEPRAVAPAAAPAESSPAAAAPVAAAPVAPQGTTVS